MRHNQERMLGRILDDRQTSRTNPANVTNIAYHGKVVDIDDPINSKRIRVRIEGIDDISLDHELPWAVSLMPNFFYCLPQVGEHVIIMFVNPWNKNFTRLYMGPLQTKNLGEQPYAQDDEKPGTMIEFGFVTFDKGS